MSFQLLTLNHNSDARTFVIKVALFLTPLWLLFALYLIDDPFRVIWSYENYFPSGKNYVGLNADFVSTEIFKASAASANYDSFIFGSSQSMFYQEDDWKKYLGENASVFHFNATGESLFGINAKFKLVAKKKIKIRNAILAIDSRLLTKNDPDESASEGYLTIKHPDVSGSSHFRFHFEFIKAFLHRDFLRSYLHFRITREYKPYMKNFIMNKNYFIYTPLTNEFRFVGIEEEIKNNFSAYYERMSDQFPERRDTSPHGSVLIGNPAKLAMLKEIASILQSENTNFKIIINPLYDQKKMSAQDVAILKEFFGASNVFDFSGKNSITEWKGNYYDQSHYRPHVAKLLLDSIYRFDRTS